MAFSNTFLIGVEATAQSALGVWDWASLLGYFAVLLVVAWWVIRQKQKTSSDYFLAGRSVGWFVIGASLFASNIGSEHLVGLAGAGASSGVAMAHYELHAWCLLVLGWVLVPFYERSGVYTMPEFLERRYTPAARWVLSVISLIAYVFTKVAVTLYAGGIVFAVLFPNPIFGIDSFWIGAVGIVFVTGLYTVLGGLRAVLYTEVIQTLVLIVGSMVLTVIGLHYLGSSVADAGAEPGAFSASTLADGWNEVREVNGKDSFNLWKPWDDPDFPWVGMLFAAPIVGLWYWCTDQYIVQRTLAAANIKQARRGTIFGSYLKMLPVFLFIVPGMIALALARTNQLDTISVPAESATLVNAADSGLDIKEDHYMVDLKLNEKDEEATTYFIPAKSVVPVDGDESKLGFSALVMYTANEEGKLSQANVNKAFPVMVSELLPVGVKGIVIGGLLAALMSSLSSVFNSCSTLFTMDIYQKLHPDASEGTLVWVGRIATVVMVVLGLAWIPIIGLLSDSLYVYLQSVQAYIAPPIFAVFFLGVFFKRLNGAGCMAALIGGFIIGMARLVTQTMREADPTVFEGMAAVDVFASLNFLYFCVFLFLVSTVLLVGFSLITARPSEERLNGLTYSTTSADDQAANRNSWGWGDVFLSVFLLLIITAIYCYFSTLIAAAP